MAAKPYQMYSGVDAVRAANELVMAQMARRDDWPYPHVYPPRNAEDVHVIGTVVTPALAATVQIASYQVQSGKRFYLRAILMTVTGASTMIPGAATWTLDRNIPVGVANTQGSIEHGLVNVPIPLGSNVVEPWVLQRAREFEPLDIVRIKGTNVALSVGAPNYFIGGLFGYEVPVLEVKASK
jgi:hypothetical protein